MGERVVCGTGRREKREEDELLGRQCWSIRWEAGRFQLGGGTERSARKGNGAEW